MTMPVKPNTGTPYAIVEKLPDPNPEECDVCGTIARARIVLTSGGVLTFCGHHAIKHGFDYEHDIPESRTQGSEN
jgi:hypothetical protein